MKRLFGVVIFSLVFAALATPILAVELEVQYPPFGDVSPGPKSGPADWVHYIFFLALALTSIAAVGSLIYAGIVWMTSASSERVSNAKKQIWAAVGGVILVAGSVVILRTINPDIVSLRLPTIETFRKDADLYGDSCNDPTKYRSIETGKCENKKDNEADCSLNSECKSGKCEDGKCASNIGGGRETYQWAQIPTNQYCEDVLGRGWVGVDDKFCADQQKPEPKPGHYDRCCGFSQPQNP